MVEVSQLAKAETSCHVSIAIQNDRTSLKQKLTLPWTMPEKKILKVPHQLRKVNEKAYEPYVISIGPYHHGKDHLKEMEGLKVQSLNRLLDWSEQSVEKYIFETEKMVEEARKCYTEPLDISNKEFAEMMVLDGCFIILFFMRNLPEVFSYGSLISSSILHDLALVENQLPFFVLCKLLDIIFHFQRNFFNMVCVTDPKGLLVRWILARFETWLPGLKVDTTYDDNSIKNIKHIVHLLHVNWCPSDTAMDEYNKVQPKDGEWPFIRSATELREAGIEFKATEKKKNEKWSLFDFKFKKVENKRNEKRSLFDIKFKNGILEMPKVIIDDQTDSMYRNLIACEQFDNTKHAFLTDYILLMDSLINSGKDVELLCKSEIIDNMLGNDELVAGLFNRLGDHTNFSRESFFYAQLFKDVNKHYKSPWNSWMAYLRHKYFNTPWALISFLAAALLLLLTVLQTAFTIFPWS
ncbi:hypothetical protein SLEP1_g12280 [Rubroshorea leprosula]|nr:hypothetical protein SLEP1_g12280 [Rubroshorea leprosula]